MSAGVWENPDGGSCPPGRCWNARDDKEEADNKPKEPSRERGSDEAGRERQRRSGLLRWVKELSLPQKDGDAVFVDELGVPLGEAWNGPAQGKRSGGGAGWRNLFGGRRSADEEPAPAPLARPDRSPDSGAIPAAAPEEDTAAGAAWPRFTRWVAAQVGLGAREQAFAAQAQAHLGRQRQLQQLEGMEDASTVATRRNEASARRTDQLVEDALDELALGMAAAPVGKGLKVLRRGADTLGERLARAALARKRAAPGAAEVGSGGGVLASRGATAIKPGSSGGPDAGKRFPESIRQEAFAEDPTKTCVYCAREGTGTQVDHAISRARGGNPTIDNAQLACPHCNSSKGADEFPKNPPPDYEGPWPPDHWPGGG